MTTKELIGVSCWSVVWGAVAAYLLTTEFRATTTSYRGFSPEAKRILLLGLSLLGWLLTVAATMGGRDWRPSRPVRWLLGLLAATAFVMVMGAKSIAGFL